MRTAKLIRLVTKWLPSLFFFGRGACWSTNEKHSQWVTSLSVCLRIQIQVFSESHADYGTMVTGSFSAPCWILITPPPKKKYSVRAVNLLQDKNCFFSVGHPKSFDPNIKPYLTVEISSGLGLDHLLFHPRGQWTALCIGTSLPTRRKFSWPELRLDFGLEIWYSVSLTSKGHETRNRKTRAPQKQLCWRRINVNLAKVSAAKSPLQGSQGVWIHHQKDTFQHQGLVLRGGPKLEWPFQVSYLRLQEEMITLPVFSRTLS